MNRTTKKYNQIANEVRDEYRLGVEDMKELKPKKKFLLGIDTDGNKVTLPYVNHIFCERKNLVSIEIPELCKSLYCEGNFLTEIELQSTMVEVWCYENKITHLHVPHGVEDLRCEDNPLTSLDVPESVDWLTCNKELFDYATCKVKQVNIIY